MLELSSEKWRELPGRDGDVVYSLIKIMDNSNNIDENYLEEIEIFFNNINADMSFYTATVAALPHLVFLFTSLDGNVSVQCNILIKIGNCVASENATIFETMPKSIVESYELSLSILKKKVKEFVKSKKDEIIDVLGDNTWKFITSYIAIRGHKDMALALKKFVDKSIFIPCCNDKFIYLENIKSFDCIICRNLNEIDEDVKNTELSYDTILKDLVVFKDFNKIDVMPYIFGIYRCDKCGGKEEITKLIIDQLI